VIYSTDRNGQREGYYQALAGTKIGSSVEHPVKALRGMLSLGDSLTAAGYAVLVAAHFGVDLVDPGTSGIGSQMSQPIAARYGATAMTCSINGASIVAGVNYLTAISIQMLSRVGDAVGTVRTSKVSIAGVTGVLTSTQSASASTWSLPASPPDYYVYTFVPDAGQALPVAAPAGTALIVEPGDWQDRTLLLCMGRNNVGTPTFATQVKADIAAVFAAYKPLVRNIVLLGVPNIQSEPSGSANYSAIVALNLELAALYPGSYLDIRAAYNAGDATGTDIPAAANTADGTHYTTVGKAVWANAVIDFINTKGWYA
jgi:hypothetical protein